MCKPDLSKTLMTEVAKFFFLNWWFIQRPVVKTLIRSTECRVNPLRHKLCVMPKVLLSHVYLPSETRRT